MKKRKIGLSILFCISMISGQYAFTQGSPDYTGGLKVKLNDSGSKYFRLISWAQVQAVYSDNVPANTNNISLNLRRARILMYSQITDKFLILTHFGLNSLTANTMSPVGKGDGAQLFFHDVWAQYNVAKNHTVGGGLHYFNGISRLNNQSTLNMLTLDNNRQSWSTIGLSDQFARHLGVFAKGSFGKLQYRLAVNDAITNGLDARDADVLNQTVYGGKRLLGSKSAGFAYAGYFEYQLLDKESNFLPYKVGSYLGAKKVLNIGAGFFAHPNGSVSLVDTMGTLEGQNVLLFAGDVFYEAPIGENGSALSVYATYQLNDYGKDYLFSAYGTGSMLYGHIGYVVPGNLKGTKFQPYVSYGLNTYEAVADTRNILGVGVNTYMSGHNSKLTLEYKNSTFGTAQTNAVTLQAMIYL